MKTKVYNLIILDESGSMGCIRQQAVEGVNQTFSTIRQAQLSHDDQEHIVSFVTFDSCRTNSIYDLTPIKDVKDLALKDYNPGACTPLYDAMGFALTKLRTTATTSDLVLVTIITDGYENASREYNGKTIKALVDELTQLQDWVFTYIGANQNVKEVATSLGVSNTMAFREDIEGTRAMWVKENKCRESLFDSFDSFMSVARAEGISPEEIKARIKEFKRRRSQDFFKEIEEEENEKKDGQN